MRLITPCVCTIEKLYSVHFFLLFCYLKKKTDLEFKDGVHPGTEAKASLLVPQDAF